MQIKPKQKHAFAYIQYEDEASAEKSLVLDKSEIVPGRPIGVAISNPAKRHIPEADEKILFVSNLADSIIEEDLKEFFYKVFMILKVDKHFRVARLKRLD